MHKFIEKFGDQILGTLSGFDRLVFRATPRRLNIFHPENGVLVAKGMEEYFWQNELRFKKFGDHVKFVSGRVKEAFLKPFVEQKLPVEFVRSSKLNKDEWARALAAKQSCGFSIS